MLQKLLSPIYIALILGVISTLFGGLFAFTYLDPNLLNPLNWSSLGRFVFAVAALPISWTVFCFCCFLDEESLHKRKRELKKAKENCRCSGFSRC